MYVDWSIEWDGYKPIAFEHPSIRCQEGSSTPPSWADPEEDVRRMEFRVIRGSAGQSKYKTKHGDRDTFEEQIYVAIEEGEGPVEPRNPRGRTGIRGRGILGRWGPNHAVDAIVTRYHPEDGQLQVVVIQRQDAHRETWALPGGMVEAGDMEVPVGNVEDAKGADMTRRRALRRVIAKRLRKSDAHYERSLVNIFPPVGDDTSSDVFKGYVDDPRNTDNAWIETTAKHFHCGDRLGKELPLAEGVEWLDIDPRNPKYDNLYGSHKLWVDAVHYCMDQNSARRAARWREVTGDWDVCITAQEREHFRNEMCEWMDAEEKDGGGGNRCDVEPYFDLLQSAFVNRSDAHGNTALHQAST